MPRDNEIQCCMCDNKLTFGGASGGMVEQMGGMAAAMEMMARQAGWTKHKITNKWECRNHAA